jgi:hypothetical protein
MASVSKGLMVVLRFFELAFAAIIAGIIGHYLSSRDSSVDSSSRIIYTITIASISLLVALVFFLPFSYTFYSFVIDIILFICWIVDFGLLTNVGLYFASSLSKWQRLIFFSSATAAVRRGIDHAGVQYGVHA